MVLVDGEFKVAQYGQWDGYPSYTGTKILEFLRSWDRERFERNVRNAHWLTREEVHKTWIESGFVNMEVASKHTDMYPHLSRDTGCGILEFVQEADHGIGLVDSKDFAADSLFCEWGWLVNLDENTLEVYGGFNKSPLTEGDRFLGFDNGDMSDGYSPIKMIHKFDLDDLPDDEAFLEILEPEEEDTC